MSPPGQSNCPQCGAVVPAESLGGQCVSCLLRLGMEAERPAPLEASPALAAETRRFGGYDLIQELGRGGMGVVWKAREPRLNRLVALKLLLEGQFATEAAIKRFEFEAEAAANLEHPNIVPIYEVGQHDGWPYFAMKLIDGRDLGARMAEFALPPPMAKLSNGKVAADNGNSPSGELSKSALRDLQCRIAELIAKVARALHFAHQRGILHRDLKPSNILIDSAGQPHLTDFGLAKRVNSDGRLTLTGALLGSPHYMAPEQASQSNGNPSTAADSYSLGVILYELLTGRLPFKGESPLATLQLLVETDPVAPRSINSGVSPDLETICLKCLAKDPARRYRSAEALAEDLECWIRREPISARPPTSCERLVHRIRLHPVQASLIGITVLALLLTLTFFYASYRTYYWLMGKIADEHLTATPDPRGVYRLPLQGFEGFRCTANFWKNPICYKHNPAGRYARLEFTNMPPDLVVRLQVRVFGDIPGMADSSKTPILTNGQTFFLGNSPLHERAFYLGAINFRVTNVLAQASQARADIVLLGRPGSPDPYRPIGRQLAWDKE